MKIRQYAAVMGLGLGLLAGSALAADGDAATPAGASAPTAAPAKPAAAKPVTHRRHRKHAAAAPVKKAN
jgi:hypothetical protein